MVKMPPTASPRCIQFYSTPHCPLQRLRLPRHRILRPAVSSVLCADLAKFLFALNSRDRREFLETLQAAAPPLPFAAAPSPPPLLIVVVVDHRYRRRRRCRHLCARPPAPSSASSSPAPLRPSSVMLACPNRYSSSLPSTHVHECRSAGSRRGRGARTADDHRQQVLDKNSGSWDTRHP